MKCNTRIWQFAAAVTLGSLLALLAPVASAQSGDNQPQRIAVTTVQVKPDMVGTFEDLVKQTIGPLTEEGSVPWRNVWTTGPFGPAFQYAIVSPVTNFAQYDQGDPLSRAFGAAGMAQWISKISKTVDSVSTQLLTLRQGMSIVSNTTTPYKYARVTDLTVLPGKGGEFADLMRSEYFPAVEKSGTPDFWIYSSGVEGRAGVFTIVYPTNSYAEFDGPPAVNRGLGPDPEARQAARQAFDVKRNALISSYESCLIRLVPELSFNTSAGSN